MVQENASLFVDWYLANKEGNGSNYLSKFFKNDRNLFLQQVQEYADEFAVNFDFNPFNIDYKVIDVKFINKIQEKLKEKNSRFIEYNRKNSNGIPNAIFGKNNYLRFLNEILIINSEKNEVKTTAKLPFRKEFINFLIEEQDYTIGSANSYASYVASANKEIFSQVFELDFLMKLADLLTKEDGKEINKHLDLGLTQIIKSSDTMTKSKYKSGFLEYQNFINAELVFDLIDSDEEISDDTTSIKNTDDDFTFSAITKVEHREFLKEIETLREGNYVITFDQESIVKNFYFRLTTQDRLYGAIFYPISLIKKLFYLDKENRIYFDELINNQIKRIKIFSEGQTFSLNSISDLIIIPGSSVSILGNDTFTYSVFTEDGYDNSFKMMNVELFREIAIDHVVPMKELLIQHGHKLPKLKSITNLLKNNGISGSGKELLKSVRQTGNLLIDTGLLGLHDIKELKIELEFLDSLSEFQLMDWKENLKKNRKK